MNLAHLRAADVHGAAALPAPTRDPLAEALADAAAVSHLEARIKSLAAECGELRANNHELGASLEAANAKIERACQWLRLFEESTWVTDFALDALKVLEGRS